MTIGEKIKHIRRQKGLSQEELQERSGIQRNFISLIENNHRGLSYQTLSRLAQAMGVTPGYITDYAVAQAYPQSPSGEAAPWNLAEAPLPGQEYQGAEGRYVPILLQDTEKSPSRLPVFREWLPCPEQPERYVCQYFREPNQALSPTIQPGSLVCIDKKQTDCQALEGKVVAMWEGKTLFLRRLHCQKKRIIGIPESTANSKILILPHDSSVIFGQVIWYLTPMTRPDEVPA